MATYMKAILTFAFSEFKQLLDKNLVLLQLSNMVDEEATQTAECNLFFSHFVFCCLQKALKGESCLLLTLWVAIFESQLGGGQESDFLSRKFDFGDSPAES